ncbi:MAG TPA: hypothetical protein PKN50_03695 [Spirochaetota bacterium]|nr:hypothetical protein [Spirochaetota bacterium]HPV42784.1 hypothetical protein [Spirochaetota bacterium]
MALTSDTEILLSQIKNTISLWSESALSLEKAKQSYAKLHDQYLKLERKYIAENPRGFIKGLLHNHNISNNAALTALYAVSEKKVDPLAFAGDAILLNAIPKKIVTQDLDGGTVRKVRLGDQEGKAFTLFVKGIVVGRDSIAVATVASSPIFNMRGFELLADLLSMLYRKNREIYTPVMLNYINDLSSEISRLFNGGKNGPVYADYFILYNRPGSFSGAGVYNLIDFSHFVVKTLKSTYPANVHIFALSLSNYFVLYDETTKIGLEIKRNRIDFNYHGNNIPYKVIHTEIGTQQQLYLFLESL